LGAELVAIDYRENPGFRIMERLAGEPFDYRIANVYDLDPQDIGVFEIVLFLGVLYHLPDMFRALYVLREVCRPDATLLLETEYDPGLCPEQAVARYFTGNTFQGDGNFWWNPNRKCVYEMLHDAGFDVVREDCCGNRLLVEATASPTEERLRKILGAYGVHPRRQRRTGGQTRPKKVAHHDASAGGTHQPAGPSRA
jgi:tRNA (mo5U34)-methyltransferase